MNKILLYGPSGLGKTASIRNLPAGETAIINTDKKALPLQGWRNLYHKESLPDGSGLDWELTNYIEPSQPANVLLALDKWEQVDRIKYIVLDTLTHIMTSDYMTNTIGRDYKAYQNMGGNVFKILDKIRASRKNILVIAHSDTDYDDAGNRVVKMKSHGKMIDAMVPPSFFTTVLVPFVKRTEDGTEYLFSTQSDGADAAKSPCYFIDGVAKPALELTIPNDIKHVFDKLDEFENNV
jgi:hypothetical protein